MCRWKVIVFPHSDGKRADSYIAKLERIATVWVKSCGVVVRALSSAVWLLHRPLLSLPSGTCRHLTVATSFHTTSVGGTVSRYICVSLWEVRHLEYICIGLYVWLVTWSTVIRHGQMRSTSTTLSTGMSSLLDSSSLSATKSVTAIILYIIIFVQKSSDVSDTITVVMLEGAVCRATHLSLLSVSGESARFLSPI